MSTSIKAIAGIIINGQVAKPKRGNRLFSDQEESDIVQYYQGGMSLTQIQSIFQCSNWTTICNVLKRRGISRRRRGNVVREITQQEKEFILQKCEAGQSVLAISKGLNMSYEKLRTWMIKERFNNE